jgi:hypothetical protein
VKRAATEEDGQRLRGIGQQTGLKLVERAFQCQIVTFSRAGKWGKPAITACAAAPKWSPGRQDHFAFW